MAGLQSREAGLVQARNVLIVMASDEINVTLPKVALYLLNDLPYRILADVGE